MGTTLAQAYVQVIPSAKGIKGSLTNLLKGETVSAGNSAGESLGSSLVTKLKGIIAAAGIGTAIKTAVTQGAELEQNLGGTEAVFGKFAKNIQTSAKDAYKNMGLSASDYMATANKMGSLFQGSGIEQQRSLELTSAAMQRAADVASVMGLDTSMAMESIAGAAKGNFTMMDNLGVAMNATTLQAYALEKGVNFDWKTASNAEKAELAMRMFMDRTSQYQGNFAKESEKTLSGAFGAMKAAAQDFAGSLAIGENVTPQLDNLLQTVVTFGSNLLQSLANIFTGLPPAIASVFSAHSGEWLQNGLGLMQKIGEGAKNGIPEFLSNALPMVKDFSGKLREGAGQLVEGGLQLITNIVKGISQGLPSVAAAIPSILGDIVGFIIENLPKFVTAGLQMITSIREGFANAVPQFLSSIPEYYQRMLSAWKNIKWAELGKAIVDFIVKGFTGSINSFLTTVKTLATNATNALKSVNWSEAGKNIITTLANAAKSAGETVKNALKYIGDTAAKEFKALDWKGTGKAVIEFIKTAASAAGSLIQSALQTIGKAGIEAFKNTDWKGVGKKVIETLAAAAKGAFKLIVEALKAIGKFGIDAFKQIDWLSVGKAVVEGIAKGITAAPKFIFDALSGLGKAALQKAKEIFKIGSPSKLFADEVGAQIPAGVAQGVNDNSTKAQEAIEKMSKDIVDKAKLIFKEWTAEEDVTKDREAAFWAEIAGQCVQGTEAYATALQNSSEALKKFEEEQGKYREEVRSGLDLTDKLFSGFDDKFEMTKENIIKNMRDQVQSLRDWASNMQKLAKRGIDEGLLEYLAKLGPDGAKLIAEFGKMSHEELMKVNQLWQQAMKLPDKVVNGLAADFNTAAAYASQGFANGINPLAGQTEAQQTAAATLAALQNGLQEHSPSKATAEMGKNLGLGLVEGIKSSQKDTDAASKNTATSTLNAFKAVDWKSAGKAIIDGIKSAITSMANTVVSSLKTVGTNALNNFKKINWKDAGTTAMNAIKSAIVSLQNSIMSTLQNAGKLAFNSFKNIQWLDLGKSIVSGIIQGVSNSASSLYSALKNLAKEALKAAKDKLKIGSPSRVFRDEVGKWIPEGIAAGITGNMNIIESALGDITDLTPSNDDSSWSTRGGHSGKGLLAVNYGGVNINVYAREGQNELEIAEEVSRILNQQVYQQRAVFA